MESLTDIISMIQKGLLGLEEGEKKVRDYFYRDMGHTKLDLQRMERTGYPEVIYCERKTAGQVLDILGALEESTMPVLLTRVTAEQAESVKARYPEAEFNPLSRTFAFHPLAPRDGSAYIGIITAGTSDLPVAEEAAVTAEVFGSRVKRISDVGVAGIHRLLDKLEIIRGARVLVVVAGMEGALPSVVGGLVDKPVIAVPTSVGYGASFGGLSALLGMLNSCSPGVAVVNIDNGFGAGYLAGMISSL